MGVFKQLTNQDIIVSPLELNKSYHFSSSAHFESHGIERFTGSITDVNSYYNSIKQLYYSNYISGSDGEISNASTASINLDGTYSGPVYNTLYNNYLNTSLNPQRYFPTGSSDIIGILSIPKNLYGDHIKPKSLNIVTPSGSYIDDGEGIIYSQTSVDSIYGFGTYGTLSYGLINQPCGNIIYEHGIILITSQDISDSILNLISSSDVQIGYSSSFTIYETQYKCTIEENDFGYSYNPSLLSSSNEIYNHFTASYFSPYITTIGLYNDNDELLAVSKLSQPLPTSRVTDINILVKLDLI